MNGLFDFVLEETGRKEGHEEVFRCPVCASEGTLSEYDVLGANLGNVFCNQCQTELRC